LTGQALATPSTWIYGYDGTDPNTIALWHYEESSGNTSLDDPDTQAGAQDGTLQAGVSRVAGKFGNGVSFSGAADSYVDYTGTSALKPESITVEAWVNWSKAAGMVLLSNEDNASSERTYELEIRDTGDFHWRTWSKTSGEHARARSTLSQAFRGEWVHLAGTYDAATGWKRCYINGVEDTAAAVQVAANDLRVTNPAPTELGRRPHTSHQPLTGLVDEVRISDVARTFEPTERPDQWHPGYDGTDPFTVALWHFEEPSGNAAFDDPDTQLGPQDGTLQSGVSRVAGWHGQGVAFDGTGNSYIDFTDTLALKPQSLTVEAWLNWDPSGHGTMCFISNEGQTVANSSYDFEVRSDNSIRWRTWSKSGSEHTQANAFLSQEFAGEWVHVAGTYDAVTGWKRVFVNGIEDTAAAVQVAPNDLNSVLAYSTWLGQRPHTSHSYYTGLIDEVRISNFARTFAPIPEPSTFCLAGIGLTLAGLWRRRRK